MANHDSYIPILAKFLSRNKPNRILEWGPGESTEFMNECVPDARIVTVENLFEYYKKWDRRWKHKKNINLIYLPEKKDYTNPPVKGKFDLIFVDGRHRVDCMKRSLSLLSDDGVLILHDSERDYYNDGIKLYKKIDERGNTVCLMKG